MFNRKEAKRNARKALKAHYGIYVIILIIAAVLGTSYSISLSSFEHPVNWVEHSTSSDAAVDTYIEEVESYESEFDNTMEFGLRAVYADSIAVSITDLVTGKETVIDEDEPLHDLKLGALEIGHRRGVFANIVNSIHSGAIIASIWSVVRIVMGSDNAAYIAMTIAALLITIAAWTFITNTYRVVYKRMFMEGMRYERLPISRVFFLARVKRWFTASLSMLKLAVYETLWDLTIIGGIIKRYSYYAAPYIVAENPSYTGSEAITLSRKMMYGHKFECFKMELSFIGWILLGVFTFGLLEIFYTNPYREATYAEFYAYVRELAKEAAMEGTERLKDEYLFKHADEETINKAYADIIEKIDEPDLPVKEHNGIWKFAANYMGIIPSHDADDQNYESNIMKKALEAGYRDALAGKSYPARLNPVHEIGKKLRGESLRAFRRYSFASLAIIFVALSLFGWCFEVGMHLLTNGEFVNRGFLHGPWIPIYGGGGLLILVVLNRLRTKPAYEFIAAIILCGVLEYATSLILSIATGGGSWWDYHGYWFNLNGRICAEGLLVFGVGGMAIVYLAAPFLDNLARKMPPKVRNTVAIVLMAVFFADVAYSIAIPNTGKGITSAPKPGQ